jgi:hypothetical protein
LSYFAFFAILFRRRRRTQGKQEGREKEKKKGGAGMEMNVFEFLLYFSII